MFGHLKIVMLSKAQKHLNCASQWEWEISVSVESVILWIPLTEVRRTLLSESSQMRAEPFLNFSKVTGQKTQIIREKHVSPFWDNSWFPMLCIDNISVCTTRAGAHRQCSCMYHKGRCPLTTFLYVPWGQEHTDNVSVCIMKASTHWQCFCMYHKGKCALTMFLYVSQGQVCTDNVSVCITGQVHTDSVSVHITGQVHTDNVPVCIMRADVPWQCFCVYHEGRWTLTMFLYVP